MIVSTLPRVLETRRLRLEAVEPRHADEWWPEVQASHAELSRWLAWAINPTLDELREWATQKPVDWEAGRMWVFALVHDGRAIGNIGIGEFEPILRRAEIGYWISTRYAGRGLMTEAASAVVSFAFDHLRVHRLELHAGPHNIGSCRVAEKMGFRYEGLLRDGSFAVGGYYDVNCYGLLETDDRPRLH